MDAMREIFGSAWTYYLAFGILIAWAMLYKFGGRQ